MSATIHEHPGDRAGLRERVRGAAISLPHRPLLVVLGVLGLFASFGGMLATGDTGRLGAAAFVPWVMLLGVELGPLAGVVFGGAALALYGAAVVDVGGAHDAIALAVRAAALVGVGLASGLFTRRISADARALQATSALQQALLDSTVDGICLTDEAGNILFSNAPLRRASVELGLPLTGTVAERLLTLADRMTEPERYRERMHALATSLEPSEDDFELAESGRVFRGYTASVRHPDGTLVGRIWTLREVTADRRLERLRDAFVAAVSHELRTPLTSISGFLEMLEDEEHALPEAGRNYLGVIRRGTSRLQRIVEDLLLVAQIEADRLELRPRPADLAEIAAAAVEEARPAAEEKQLALVLDSPEPLPLEADASRLGQVLDNLVSNAIKFTPAGGTVTVSTSNGDGWARLEVADSGIGIPHDEIGLLFSRFYRASTATRRAIPGTGLGLVIARAIVEGHGGAITLDSREGEGTRVTVQLPTS